MQVYTLNNKEKRKGGGGGVGIKPTTKGTHFKMKPPRGKKKEEEHSIFYFNERERSLQKNKMKVSRKL